jgi:preprotein translocase subunit SecA
VTGMMLRVVEEHLRGAEDRADEIRRSMAAYEEVSDDQCAQIYQMRRATLNPGTCASTYGQ